MREHLYKGKRVDTNEWIFGDVYHGLNGCIYINTVVKIDEKSKCNKQIIVHPETVCQFTGLLDKNGNKIFEGDKVFDGEKEISVLFESGSFGYEEEVFKIWMSFCHCYTKYKDLEITGNIHDETH